MAFSFYIGSELNMSLLAVPINYLPSDEHIFNGKIANDLIPVNFYDISVIDINCKKLPLKMHKQEQVIFKLFVNFENKKYVKFKKEPIIFINIFNNEKQEKD